MKHSKKVLFLLSFLLLSLGTLSAQNKELNVLGDWYMGTVFLNNGDSLKGLVAYSFQADIIQVKSAQRQYTFSSMQITGFVLMEDSTAKRYRVYNYHNKDGFEVPVLFEELVVNNVFKVLVREEVAYQNRSTITSQGFVPDIEIYYSYFFMKGNSIVHFEDTKRDALTLFAPYESEIEQYAKHNKLRFYNKPDLKFIFEYYYSLITHVEDSSNK